MLNRDKGLERMAESRDFTAMAERADGRLAIHTERSSGMSDMSGAVLLGIALQKKAQRRPIQAVVLTEPAPVMLFFIGEVAEVQQLFDGLPEEITDGS